MSRFTARRTVLAAVVCVGASIIGTGVSLAQLQLQPVALSEMTPGGAWGPFRSFRLSPTINASGDVAFNATNTSYGVNWKWSPSGYVYISGSRALAPIPPGGAYGLVTSPTLSDTGRTAFGASYQPPSGLERVGIFAGSPGAISLIAGSWMPAPGRPGEQFGYLFSLNVTILGPPAVNSFGRIAFGAELVGDTYGYSIWTEQDGYLQLVTRDFDHAPGTPPDTHFDGLSTHGANLNQDVAPPLNDYGQVAFRAGLDGPGVDDFNRFGLWAQRAGTLQLVARAGQPAPGILAGASFLDFSEVGFNNQSSVAFRGMLTGPGLTAQNDRGIWLAAPESSHMVARAGDIAPGTAGADFVDFDRPVLNGADSTAFSGRLTGSGVTTDNDSGAWIENAGLLHLITREGDGAPGLGPDVLFGDTIEVYAMNAIGQTIINGTLTGTGVTAANDRALWVHDLTGATRLVLQEGEAVEVFPGDLRTISGFGLSFLRSGGQDGKKETLNDAGQFVVALAFTDGSSGVFITNVPEPSACAMLVCLLGAVRWGRGKRLLG